VSWSKCETCIRIRDIADYGEREASNLNKSMDGCDMAGESHIEKEANLYHRQFCETRKSLGVKTEDYHSLKCPLCLRLDHVACRIVNANHSSM